MELSERRGNGFGGASNIPTQALALVFLLSFTADPGVQREAIGLGHPLSGIRPVQRAYGTDQLKGTFATEQRNGGEDRPFAMSEDISDRTNASLIQFQRSLKKLLG